MVYIEVKPAGSTMPQPFLISSFKYGLFQYYNPWLAPKDAFVDAQNIVVEQGCISTRLGLSPWKQFFSSTLFHSNAKTASFSINDFTKNSIEILADGSLYIQDVNGSFVKSYGNNDVQITLNGNTLNFTFASAGIRSTFITFVPKNMSPIRGIASFIQQGSQAYGTVAFNDTDLCVFINDQRVHNVLVKQHVTPDTTSAAYNIKVPFNFNVSSLSVAGTIAKSNFEVHYGIPAPSGSPVKALLFNNGTLTITLKSPPAKDDVIYYTLSPTGLHSDAGSVISWDSSRNLIAFTNGINPITFFDIEALTLSRPPMPITLDAKSKQVNQIQTAKYLKFFNNRLLLLAPTIINTNSQQDGKWEQSIRWSSLFLDQHTDYSYWNFVADTYGYGGEFSPDTNERIVSCGLVKDKLVAWFSNSSFIVSPTQNPSYPFVFYKLNSSLLADCAHTATDTNTHSQILGQTGYIQTDGASTERIDYNIINVINNINFDLHQKVSAYRFIGYSNLIGILFPTKYPQTLEPNQAVLYNILEDSFSALDFSDIQLSIFGNARASSKLNWGDMRKVRFTPYEAALPFTAYVHYKTQIYNVAGGTNGCLYKFSDHSTDLKEKGSTPQNIDWFFKTCRFAPFLESGKASTINYIDIYFEGQSQPLEVIMDVFVNGQRTPAKSIEFSLFAEDKAQTFKRVLVQMTGFFIEFKFRNNPSQPLSPKLKIIGMILWADPAGDVKDPKYLR